MTTDHHREPEHIAVGVDGSLSSRAAIRWAIAHASEGAHITLVHAWQASAATVDADLCNAGDDSGAHALLSRECARAEQLPRAPEVEISTRAAHGDPRTCLTQLDCDLLVVGARGHSGVGGLLLGSVSTHLARHAPNPLVIIPYNRTPAAR